MPATLVSLHAASAVSVEDLNNREREIALYASDMPTTYRYRVSDEETLKNWITQGAARIGLDALYVLAAENREYRRRWLNGQTTPAETAAHTRRFPESRRLRRSGELASTFTVYHVGVSDTAKTRQAMSASAFPAPVRLAVTA
ncbi:hypothetical protein GR925_02495 [Streptomyces sp. HUCO-GS316]|uniref:hypothetical protein n=1 Tax=Streptomyces sp. HUCO-GS316 TaxID=2692198 RepID=UPI00136A13DB|nr:hypothetical protein [Streptomyces sp. HUCO-GS316]MXM62344.1 hypothetical protein [Streptomyces sp. HUCO-GS316]